jgi:hypothetical protein
MINRRYSVARYLVAVTTIAALIAPLAVGAAGQPGGSPDFQPRQYWKSVQGPNWRSGADRISQYAWDPVNTEVLYVTNGTEIQVSGNQGDTWSRAYVLPQLTDVAGFTADDSQIVDLQVDEGSAATDAYAVVVQTVGGTSRPHVIASHDGGRAWAPSDIGLPPTGRPIALRVAPNDPNELYLALAVGDDTVDLMYKSEDSGATWIPRSDFSNSRPQELIKSFEVDPQDSDQLWASGDDGLYHSANAGASFQKIDRFTRATGPIDVFNQAGEAQVSVFLPGLGVWEQKRPEGWTELPLRGADSGVSSVAHGATNQVLFITSGGNAFAWNVQTESWVDLDPPATSLQGMVAGRGLNNQSFSAHNTQTIQIYEGPVTDFIEKLPRYLVDVPQITTGSTPQQFPPRLNPSGRKIVLEPGEKKTVSYRLKLPPRPLPLDVFFLLDTSASTTTFLQNVASSVAQIASALNEKGITARFGLADYRAYPSRNPPKRACGPRERASMNDCEANYAYRKRLDLGYGHEDELEEALETLVPDGGGEFRSMYAALYQAVTGAGQDLGLPELSADTDHDIPPGQNARFASSVKVILHAVDESFPTNETAGQSDPGGLNGVTEPDMTSDEEAVAALGAETVYQVGLSTGSESLADLKKVARGTNAFAPAGGVDCDGNGSIDVPAGDPLVCSVNPNRPPQATGLPDAIEKLLYATAPTTDITFDVTGAPTVVKNVAPEGYGAVLQSTNRLEFEVTFSCPRLSAARTYDVAVRARLEERADPSAEAILVCRPPDPDDPPEDVLPPLPPAPPAAAALVALALPPPPPPPPPILEISSASQSQSQAQAQAGMVHQEQEQPQLASVTASRDIEQELAFSRYREDGESLVTPIRALGAGAVVMSFAFGFLMLSQELAREKVLNRRR